MKWSNVNKIGPTAGGIALALPANARKDLGVFCSSTSGAPQALRRVLSNTPDEIWHHIVGFLSTRDLELFAGVHPRSFLWAHAAVRQHLTRWIGNAPRAQQGSRLALAGVRPDAWHKVE